MAGKRRTPAPGGGRGPEDAQLGGSERPEDRPAHNAPQLGELVDLAQARAARQRRSPFYVQQIVGSAIASALLEIEPVDRGLACACFIRGAFEAISDAAGANAAANIALQIATHLADVADGGPGHGAA
jgi:hypothetical protein